MAIYMDKSLSELTLKDISLIYQAFFSANNLSGDWKEQVKRVRELLEPAKSLGILVYEFKNEFENISFLIRNAENGIEIYNTFSSDDYMLKRTLKRLFPDNVIRSLNQSIIGD